MRLHRLSIQAFGPFPGREDIDFDELTENGLFLLHGPTGAGKTSVLDAVCYALYAQVPGARQQAKRLRSDHAEAHIAPEVTLEFTARGRRFEVMRSPEWQRPVKRGTGTTTEKAKSMLREKVDGTWLEGTRDHKETALQITELLGMKVDQFTRVVLLPQGDFADFLKAESRQRADLLQQLFATDRFSRIEKHLADRHAAAEDAVAGLNATVAELVARTAQAVDGVLDGPADAAADHDAHDDTDGEADGAASGAPMDQAAQEFPAQLPEHGDLEAAGDYIASVGDRLAVATSAARAAADETASALAASRHARDDLISRAARHARLEELDRDRAEFEAGEPARARDREALANHRRAAAVRTALETYDSAAAALETSDETLRDQERRAGRNRDDALVGDIDELRAELVRLADLRAEEQQNDERRSEAEQAETRLAELIELRDGDAKARQDLAARRAQLSTTRDELRDLAAGASALRAESDRAEASLAAARSADRLRGDLESAEQTLRTAIDVAQQRRTEYLDARERRLAGMAGELAADLEDGRACPVCGSTTHPSPAVRRAGAVDASAEQRAEASSSAADSERRRADAAVAALRTRLSDAAARAGDVDTETASECRDAAAGRARESSEAAERVTRLADEITAADAELERLDAAVDRRGADIAAADRRLHDLSRLIEQYEQKRRSIVGETPVADAIDTATARKDALEGLHRAAETARADSERADTTRRRAEAAAAEAGFGDIRELRAALMTDHDEEQARLRQNEAHDHAAELRTRAGEPDLVTALDERNNGIGAPTEADRRQADRDFTAADTAHRHAVERRAVTARARDAVAGIDRKFASTTRSAGDVLARHRLTYRLSELARGRAGNELRMSLSNYVLAARLEAVADAASSRLLVMSQGRYLIRHTDARAGHGRLSGLGLEVLDSHTGTARDPRTLSGGESFQASLALALGLADVVQAESGGTDLETLFIDEGFGSLDDQSLELVLDTLDGLRAGGRAVGVISHVREMKDRIVSSLEIEKSPHGSRVGAVRLG